jgi:hypothetical protein
VPLVGAHVPVGSDGQPLKRFVPFSEPESGLQGVANESGLQGVATVQQPATVVGGAQARVPLASQEPSAAVPTEPFASVSGVSSEGAPQANHN